MTTQTIAEQISWRYSDNGNNWHDNDGVHLADACLAKAVIDYATNDSNRYVFADSSAIVILPWGWDIGYEHCWCMQGNGHGEHCTAETCHHCGETEQKYTCRECGVTETAVRCGHRIDPDIDVDGQADPICAECAY